MRQQDLARQIFNCSFGPNAELNIPDPFTKFQHQTYFELKAKQAAYFISQEAAKLLENFDDNKKKEVQRKVFFKVYIEQWLFYRFAV